MKISVQLVVVSMLLIDVVMLSDAVRIHFIHWNASNPLFSDPRSSHVIEIRGGRREQPWDYEQANIICPFYRRSSIHEGLDEHLDERLERYVIYNVTRHEYEQCRIGTNNAVTKPRIVALCDKPFKPNFFTLTFRPFSPTPGAFEFHPGHDYHFISSSSPADLSQSTGGRCKSHHMRLIFRIKDINPEPDVPTNSLYDDTKLLSESGLEVSNYDDVQEANYARGKGSPEIYRSEKAAPVQADIHSEAQLLRPDSRITSVITVILLTIVTKTQIHS